MIFIGLEISSIATYVLAGYLRDDKRNNESAMKYFLLGSFATASCSTASPGSTAPPARPTWRVRAGGASAEPPVLLLIVAARPDVRRLWFKVSGAPFQMWAPDVYQGAPAPVTAFMSAGPKAAAFAIFLRLRDRLRIRRRPLGAAHLGLGAGLDDHR
jgi:NADH-quinone oxidoreductase subunit N